jgi:hypothetical protein
MRDLIMNVNPTTSLDYAMEDGRSVLNMVHDAGSKATTSDDTWITITAKKKKKREITNTTTFATKLQTEKDGRVVK